VSPASGSSILPAPPEGVAAPNAVAVSSRTFLRTNSATPLSGSFSPTSTALPLSDILPVT
jgi:hypothetical protein